MLMRMISVVLIMSVLTTSSLAAVEQEPQSAVSKIRETVMKAVEKRRLVTVILKIKRENRNKYSGTPGNITEPRQVGCAGSIPIRGDSGS